MEKLKNKIPSNLMKDLSVLGLQFGIDTNLKLAHFLAQVHHESGGFEFVRENLNYSAKGLLKTFGKYFKDVSLVNKYARKPESIANRVYANRMGNGTEASGDGWKFRGRGYIQLTGKSNYLAFQAFLIKIGRKENIIENPDLVATEFPLLSAAFWWSNNGLNAIAAQGDTVAVVKAVTKRVNGGSNGLDDRIKQFVRFMAALK